MRAAQVKVGATYTAKVSGRVVKVRVDETNPRGGWNATNLETGRPVRIRGAQRLRELVEAPNGAGRDAMGAAWRGLQVRVTSGELARMGPFELAGRKPAMHNGQPEYRYEIRLADGRTWSVWETDCEVTGGTPPRSRREELAMAGTAAKRTTRKSTAKTPAAKRHLKSVGSKSTAKKSTAKAPRKAPAKNVDKAARDKRIIALNKEGKTLAAIGAEVGMSGMGVYNVLKRHGIKGK